jgi:hypothetical protein
MFRKHLLPAVAAGLAAVLIPVASASALPIAGSGGTALQPPAPSPNAPHGIRDVVVTTDSVVATATIVYDGAPGDLSVLWGDGTSSRPSNRPPTASVPGHPAPNTSGTYVLQHRYAEPSDGAAFTRHVSVVVPGATVGRDITITPRYRVSQYTLFFSPLNHCDTFLEEYTEWIVLRFDHELPTLPAAKRWDFDRKTHVLGEVGDPPPDFQPLPDSAVSFDVTVANAPKISYQVIEADIGNDDLGDTQTIDIQPRLGSRPVVLHFSADGFQGGSDCRAEIRADIDVRLLTPGLPAGPVASQ